MSPSRALPTLVVMLSCMAGCERPADPPAKPPASALPAEDETSRAFAARVHEMLAAPLSGEALEREIEGLVLPDPKAWFEANLRAPESQDMLKSYNTKLPELKSELRIALPYLAREAYTNVLITSHDAASLVAAMYGERKLIQAFSVPQRTYAVRFADSSGQVAPRVWIAVSTPSGCRLIACVPEDRNQAVKPHPGTGK